MFVSVLLFQSCCVDECVLARWMPFSLWLLSNSAPSSAMSCMGDMSIGCMPRIFSLGVLSSAMTRLFWMSSFDAFILAPRASISRCMSPRCWLSLRRRPSALGAVLWRRVSMREESFACSLMSD